MDITLNLISGERWNAFINNNIESTFYHQYEWIELVTKIYNYKPHCFTVTDNGQIIGVLPILISPRFFFGRRAYSIPFGSYGGPVCNDEIIKENLIKYAIEDLSINTRFLEIRSKQPFTEQFINNNNLKLNSQYNTSILPLLDNPETMLESMKKDKRRMIRRAEKSDLTHKWVRDSKNFYNLYSKNMHVLGSPTHSQKFYDAILQYFPDNSRILEVYHNDECVYGAFYLFFKTNMINSWSSTLPEYRPLNPTDYGIWMAILWGMENGYTAYDFGRSQIESGNLEFKRRWNATQQPLFYYHYSNNKYLDSTHKNPERSRFEKYWVKMPNTLVNTLGPHIRKFLP